METLRQTPSRTASTSPPANQCRTARTTSNPIAQLTVTARTDCFEVDYLIEP